MALNFGVPMGGEEISHLPSPLTTQTLKNFYDFDDNDPATLYTVPAGKKVLITQLSCSNGTGGGGVTLQIGGSTVAILHFANAGGDTLMFPTPLLATASQTIVVDANGGDNAVTVVGWEESA